MVCKEFLTKEENKKIQIPVNHHMKLCMDLNSKLIVLDPIFSIGPNFINSHHLMLCQCLQADCYSNLGSARLLKMVQHIGCLIMSENHIKKQNINYREAIPL